jgi:hypothetical protein
MVSVVSVFTLSYFFIGGVISSLNFLTYVTDLRERRSIKLQLRLLVLILVGIAVAWPYLVAETIVQGLLKER